MKRLIKLHTHFFKTLILVLNSNLNVEQIRSNLDPAFFLYFNFKIPIRIWQVVADPTQISVAEKLIFK